MAVKYDKLFHLLIDKKITNAQLAVKAGVSANIITRLKRDQYISMESIERLCNALDCGVDEILEFIKSFQIPIEEPLISNKIHKINKIKAIQYLYLYKNSPNLFNLLPTLLKKLITVSIKISQFNMLYKF